MLLFWSFSSRCLEGYLLLSCVDYQIYIDICRLLFSCKCRAQLFDLAVALLPGLDAKEIDLLFVAIGPALKVSV